MHRTSVSTMKAVFHWRVSETDAIPRYMKMMVSETEEPIFITYLIVV
jgi:hypothetical protein